MNTKMHTSKMRFIIYYYSQTCFGSFCDHLQVVTQDHTMYIQLHRAQSNHPLLQLYLSTACRNKMSNCVVVKTDCLCSPLAVYS